MKITVRLFASYREEVGASQIFVKLAEGATVRDLAESVSSNFSGLPDASRLVVAVNDEYQDHAFVLSEGDEAALIPPVSGG